MRRNSVRIAIPALALALLAGPAQAQLVGEWRMASLSTHGPFAGDEVQLSLATRSREVTMLPMMVARIDGLTADAVNGASRAIRIRLASEAGTVAFAGEVGRGGGEGTFHFSPSPAFGERLRSLGVVGELGEAELFRLALQGAKENEVGDLLTALKRYGDRMPTADELVRLLFHRVDADAVADLAEAGMRGLPVAELIERTAERDELRPIRSEPDPTGAFEPRGRRKDR